MEAGLMRMELEQAGFIIRIQNLTEEQEENTKLKIQTWLSAELQIDETLLKVGIEKIYRTGTARFYSTPREIIIKFE